MKDLDFIQALTFDVFGTVVDWRAPIIREATRLGKSKGIQADWTKFTDAWRAGFRSASDRIRRGELPWMNFEALHRMLLDDLLKEFNITGLSEAEKDHLNRAWERLKPWPDAVRGLRRLRKRFIVATLSNGNMAVQINLAKNAGLSWDCILSVELVKRYKPAKEVYEMAAEFLRLQPNQIMMVAAHAYDLRAASSVGFKTAFVKRPLEFGPKGTPEQPDASFDLVVNNLNDLVRRLRA